MKVTFPCQNSPNSAPLEPLRLAGIADAQMLADRFRDGASVDLNCLLVHRLDHGSLVRKSFKFGDAVSSHHNLTTTTEAFTFRFIVPSMVILKQQKY